jgi:hypothetical protein
MDPFYSPRYPASPMQVTGTYDAGLGKFFLQAETVTSLNPVLRYFVV